MSTQVTHDLDEVEYPTGDGQPVAETEIHRDNLLETIWMLQQWYGDRDDVYVSGNMFVYYVKGGRRRNLAPDVFVVHGVRKVRRECYKTWEEPKPTLDLCIEFTLRSTRDEDLEDKFELYRDELGVREYLLFDPYSEYLEPPQQLFRLIDGEYEPVDPVDGRLPSEVLGLHFEREEMRLRLWVPDSQSWLPFHTEVVESHARIQREYNQMQRAYDTLQHELAEKDVETERLRAELEVLKRRVGETDGNGGE